MALPIGDSTVNKIIQWFHSRFPAKNVKSKPRCLLLEHKQALLLPTVSTHLRPTGESNNREKSGGSGLISFSYFVCGLSVDTNYLPYITIKIFCQLRANVREKMFSQFS